MDINLNFKNMKYKEKLNGLKGEWTFTFYDNKKRPVKQYKYKNKIVDAGKSVIARLLNGDTIYSGEINYLALGTGSSSPADNNTQLQTEIFRTTLNNKTRTGKVIEIEVSISPTEANGNLKEAGLFIDGSAVVDTGQLFNRVAIDTVKTNLNSLIVNVIITIG